ncbi:MAG: Asp-tRNA(Asn)/Glu-tRNA(Gln) amidotransferase subunit GatC [Armatimonadetes bacterium]|nr:Asp-tRNA(Asn)/Glu-tRNA(Gln) amidotransferase subunit GatC [Armatimonadota bacterium]
MALTLDEMRHVARLARLELDDERLLRQMQHINALMSHFERLNAISTQNLEATSHATSVVDVLREDEARTGLTREEALEQAPESRDGLFIVPRIVEEE